MNLLPYSKKSYGTEPVKMLYQPLNVDDDEIRLISLAGENSAEVSITIEHVSLINPPSYTALSYCWGDQSETQTISIDGRKFQVTSNLEAALRQLRADGCVRLWADAICINQQDTEERSKQVLRMSYIYKRARKVVAWTGLAGSGSDGAIVLIGNLAHIFDGMVSATEAHEKAGEYRSTAKAMAEAQALAQVDMSLSRDTESWSAFSSFLDRPYWRRVWVIQEITVAREVIVQCGQERVTWVDVTKAIRLWNLATKPEKSNDSTLITRHASINTLLVFHENAYANKSLALLDALHQSWAALATDARDKIFALLGLTYDCANFVPSPSYKRTLAEVSIAMTISAVSSFRSLDILPLLGQGCRGKSSMPSWVPIWTDMRGLRNEFHIRYLRGNARVPVQDLDTALNPPSGLNPRITSRSRFDATPGSRPIVKFEGSVAVVSGIVIDSVHALSSSPVATREMATTDRSAGHESASLPNPYGTKAGIFHALWRTFTICGDWSLIRDDEDYLTNLWSPKMRGITQRLAPTVFSWLNHNKNLLIHGHTLRQWIEDFKWSYKPFRKILSTKLGHNFFLQLAGGGLMHALQCANQYTVIKDIDAALRMDFQLLTTLGGYVGWTPADSQNGDLICLIRGCSVPVVLRKRDEYGYYLIGASYIPGFMDGERIKDLSDGAWTSLSLY